MRKVYLRYIFETGVVAIVMLAAASSYLIREESVVGETSSQALEKAIHLNDYKNAQKIYELEKVHGALSESVSVETKIYPEKLVKAEIARLERLLEQYPTYPPLLQQLTKLYLEIGESDKAKFYQAELARLNL